MKTFFFFSWAAVAFIFSGFQTADAAPDHPPSRIIIDDYAGVSLKGRSWDYSRIGTDRRAMGNGAFSVRLGGGRASVKVENGWCGVETSLFHSLTETDTLNTSRALGPFIKNRFQPVLKGIELQVADGRGRIKIEGKNAAGTVVFEQVFQLSGGEALLQASIPPAKDLKALQWLVDGQGHAVVDRLSLLFDPAGDSIGQSVFLYTFGHLSQCYDPATGLVRDRARWRARHFSAIQATGMFALVTAVAHDLGYVEKTAASAIIGKIRKAILSLPTYKGLLPHFVTDGTIRAHTEWSSIDTAIALISTMMACKALELDTAALEEMVLSIDWEDLSDEGTRSISHGYTYSGEKLASRWDAFGSETFMMAVLYAAATGEVCRIESFDSPPTWDGSGFNDEMASLFFKMDRTDAWGNDWTEYLRVASGRQTGYFSGHDYATAGLFGLSASEVPEPWRVAEHQTYGAWGIGGHTPYRPNDGVARVGYPIIAPHYAAMIGSENRGPFEHLFRFLMSENLFSPLNNVESIGIDSDGRLHWNSLKGSWNLSLQALGAARCLSGPTYLPWRIASKSPFLQNGLYTVLPRYTAEENKLKADMEVDMGADIPDVVSLN